MFSEAELIAMEERAQALCEPRSPRPYFHGGRPVTLDELEALVLEDVRKLVSCVRRRKSQDVLVRRAGE